MKGSPAIGRIPAYSLNSTQAEKNLPVEGRLFSWEAFMPLARHREKEKLRAGICVEQAETALSPKSWKMKVVVPQPSVM
ncbi:MAG TPA: hypothetical protein DEA73_07370 [Peptococcaceae bacterium]|nr:hypothetical protein [Peptococcaceae bacterium]